MAREGYNLVAMCRFHDIWPLGIPCLSFVTSVLSTLAQVAGIKPSHFQQRDSEMACSAREQGNNLARRKALYVRFLQHNMGFN